MSFQDGWFSLFETESELATGKSRAHLHTTPTNAAPAQWHKRQREDADEYSQWSLVDVGT